MSELIKKELIKDFTEKRKGQTRVFQGLFKKSRDYNTDSDAVEIHVQRGNRRIIPAIAVGHSGTPAMQIKQHTRKTFTPPWLGVHSPITVQELQKVGFNETEYTPSGRWKARLAKIVQRHWMKILDMIEGTLEYQASQIMQNGTVTLYDEINQEVYTIDFFMKPSHLQSVVIPWANTSATVYSDLQTAAQTINLDNNGLLARRAYFGENAWNYAIENDEFKAKFKRDEIPIGAMNPAVRNDGSTLQGYVWLQNTRLDLYTYPGWYEPFDGSSKIQFMNADKVVVIPEPMEIDFRQLNAGMPSVFKSDWPFEFMPQKMLVNGTPISSRVFADKQKETFNPELKMRPLLSPVQIDAHVCITTT